MYSDQKYRICGMSPLIMHNGQLADPLNSFAKSIKAISSKRDKTEADYEEMARLEWYGGLYVFEGKPAIVSDVIEATLINAAKKRKKGIQAKAGLYVENHSLLMYDGPEDIDGLWEDVRFRYTTSVIVGKARIMRTRPIFHEWGAEIIVNYNDELLNKGEIDKFVEIAGDIVGFLDRRPKYGRFEVI